MQTGYCLILGLELQYRQRALAAAYRKYPGPVATMRPQASAEPMRWVDLIIEGDPQLPTALNSVIEFERKTGLRPAAVVPLGEFTLAPGLAIAKHYGLPYLSEETVRVCRDKLAMREALQRGGLEVPKFAALREGDDLERIAVTVGFPLVIKPSKLGTSIGVMLVERPEELGRVYRECREIVSGSAERRGVDSAALQLESFIPARREVSLLANNLGEEHYVVAIADTHLTPPPHFAEVGHYISVSDDDEAAIRAVASKACSALGISQGLANIDMRIKPDGTPIIVEVGARPPGNGLMELSEWIFGRNFFEDHIAAYTGAAYSPSTHLKPRGHGGIAFMKAAPGTIAKIKIPEKLPQEVSAVDILTRVGARVDPFTNGNCKEGALLFFSQLEQPKRAWKYYSDAAAALASDIFEVTPP